MPGVTFTAGQEAKRRAELERQKLEILEREARGEFGKRQPVLEPVAATAERPKAVRRR